jgi:beta-1,4-mannosyltransferase
MKQAIRRAQKPRVAVVVLGDLARSPRMLNHARTLAARGYPVSLIGYLERTLELSAEIRVCALRTTERISPQRSRLVFLAGSALRMSLLFFQLMARLLRERPRYILVQNPPSFPTLTAAWLAALILRGRWIVDWHNYGYSMLALRLTPANSPPSSIVKLAALYEFRAGRMAHHHLCVSQAMRDDLARRAGIDAHVLYDRPVAFAETQALTETTSRAGLHAGSRAGLHAGSRAGVSLLLVCPSGWTADEDMGLLLDAMDLAPSDGFEIHLTGDGPMRASFQPRIDALRAAGRQIHTGYLPDREYSALLARADLGVSLHHSSSGLDLAMKVSDLFAARVPVCAWDYGGSLPEQVTDGRTGFVFRTAQELAAILTRLLADRTPLAAMRRHIETEWRETWDQAWEHAAAGFLAETGDRG